MNVLGKNIHKFRKERDFSIAHLAERAGMDRTNLYRIEQTGTNYSHDSLTKISKALNVSISALFDETGLIEGFCRPVPIKLVVYPTAIEDWSKITAGTLPGQPEDIIMTDGSFGELAFAYEVRDGSMSPVLQPGDIVIVDPNIFPEANDLVLASVLRAISGKRNVMLRRYAERSDTFELIPFDDGYATEKPEGGSISILGTVVEQRRTRRRT